MKPALTIIPSVSIHPQQVNFYYQYQWEPSRPARSDNDGDYFCNVDADGNFFETRTPKHQHLLHSDRKANGIVSKSAKKKISRAIDYLLAVTTEKKITNRITGRSLQMKIAFITLTLPSAQIHDDREIINKCLNQLLIELKKYYKVRNYIWRAEKQKNNNIHFHIIIDKYIPYQELRDRWNRITEKLGYVTKYREEQINWHKNGFKVRQNLIKTWSYEKQYQAWKRGAKNHWNSPNSTDIHSIQKITNIKAYITKYMSKNPETNSENNQESLEKSNQTGRIWGCNRELSNVKGARLDMDSITEENLKKLQENPAIHSYKGDYFITYYIDWNQLPSLGCAYLFEQLALYLYEHFGTPVQLEASG